jgi:hypothetical protein
VSCDEEMKDLNTIFSNPTVLPGSLIILGPGTLQVPVQCRTFCPHPGKACLRLSSSAGAGSVPVPLQSVSLALCTVMLDCRSLRVVCKWPEFLLNERKSPE